MDRSGYMIAVEGTDGSGKSTYVAKLADKLRAKGYDVVTVRQPGGTALGEELRASVKKPRSYEVTPMTEYLIMMASRSDLVSSVIKPALAKGQVVITDRHDGSTFAYQGMILPELVESASIEADLTIFIDRNPEDALGSTEERGEDCRIEAKGLEFQKLCYERYQDYLSINCHLEKLVIDVNDGWETDAYVHSFDTVGKHIRESSHATTPMCSTEGYAAFVTWFHEQTGIGIMPVGEHLSYIHSYVNEDVHAGMSDIQVERFIEKHIGKGHKWKRDSRPVVPRRLPSHVD